MKKIFICWVFLIGAVFFMVPVTIVSAEMEMAFVTIGTGGITGVYYPAGGAICTMVNKKRSQYNIRCTVETTEGSVANINGVISGELSFGIVQHDREYQAVRGEAEWKDSGPQKSLRSVFSLHYESVTLVASVDSGIKSIYDLKRKRVSIGKPGSGQRQNSIDAFTVAGIDYKKDLKEENIKIPNAPGLIQDGQIDAFFYTVGHPNGNLREATAGKIKVSIISMPNIAEKLVAKYPHRYIKVPISVKKYYPNAINEADVVQSFGVKAILVTTEKTSDDVVYAITREVFENLEYFKTLHPCFQDLTKEDMITALSAPVHPGALRYYKEIGVMK